MVIFRSGHAGPNAPDEGPRRVGARSGASCLSAPPGPRPDETSVIGRTENRRPAWGTLNSCDSPAWATEVRPSPSDVPRRRNIAA